MAWFDYCDGVGRPTMTGLFSKSSSTTTKGSTSYGKKGSSGFSSFWILFQLLGCHCQFWVHLLWRLFQAMSSECVWASAAFFLYVFFVFLWGFFFSVWMMADLRICYLRKI
ncbi:hypothetical protein AQUCO_07800010v1 [Aquilegia coerulea]|uniref:Transmembrane protein n=1 Tax=Aquilegia coerulea TaxID=218851 RepID=A0A2G5C977_AQUCA|nr:hypothetical protein AQUCO_07800010v1 [Aquilegia coerulea]